MPWLGRCSEIAPMTPGRITCRLPMHESNARQAISGFRLDHRPNRQLPVVRYPL
jgi:hypothetical protein